MWPDGFPTTSEVAKMFGIPAVLRVGVIDGLGKEPEPVPKQKPEPDPNEIETDVDASLTKAADAPGEPDAPSAAPDVCAACGEALEGYAYGPPETPLCLSCLVASQGKPKGTPVNPESLPVIIGPGKDVRRADTGAKVALIKQVVSKSPGTLQVTLDFEETHELRRWVTGLMCGPEHDPQMDLPGTTC